MYKKHDPEYNPVENRMTGSFIGSKALAFKFDSERGT